MTKKLIIHDSIAHAVHLPNLVDLIALLLNLTRSFEDFNGAMRKG